MVYLGHINKGHPRKCVINCCLGSTRRFHVLYGSFIDSSGGGNGYECGYKCDAREADYSLYNIDIASGFPSASGGMNCHECHVNGTHLAYSYRERHAT